MNNGGVVSLSDNEVSEVSPLTNSFFFFFAN